MLNNTEVAVNQQEFIEGRMNLMPSKKHRNRNREEEATEQEKADFKSGCGDLHWVTSQTRVDHAVDTSRLQKRQQNTTYEDLIDLGRVIREVKSTSDFSLRIRPIHNPVVGAWSDSALYGAEGELLDCDEDVKAYDKKKIFSQRGAFIGLLSADHLEDVGDVPISLMDWRTKASNCLLYTSPSPRDS